MKQYLLLFLCSVQLMANNGPKVPSQMQFGGMTLKITASGQKVLQAHVDAMHSSPKHHEAMADRARLYFPIIERIFAEEKIPDGLKYLAIQESALTSDAVSSANAVGYWQFKDFTAREMGLTVDRKVDERKNIVAATRGAAKYLKQNNFYFKNWLYAVMAYQTGRGGAKKHVKESNFGASRMTIDGDTYWYVMKFLAHYIAYGESTKGPNSQGWQLAEFRDGGGRDLASIAKEFDLDVDLVKEYNKWVNGKIPTDKEYTVILPIQGNMPKGLVAYSRPDRGRIKEAVVKKYPDELVPGLAKNEESTLIKMNGLPVILAKPSDDVSSLSARVGLSEKNFRKYNELKESDELIAGEFYYMKKKGRKGSIPFHVVEENESLWDVSQQYGIRMKNLAKLNRMTIIDEPKPGRILLLDRKLGKDEEPKFMQLKKPVKKDFVPQETETSIPDYAPASNQDAKVKIHTVAKGEGLWSIAKKYEVSVEELQRWNELESADDIQEGQNLQVRAPIGERTSERKIIEYEVVAGDSLYQISRKFGMSVDDILELNNLSSPDISIGQKLRVYQN
ncbi:MAG: LysM peptidoglycan-binding domain-containing protein [Cyclobacteriaceae bacterium]